MIFANTLYPNTPLRDAITNATRLDETVCINNLLEQAKFPDAALQRIDETAKNLVQSTRQNRKKQGGLDSFLHQYDLSSEEGIALMCLAEALLRIPDRETVDKLIGDKLSTADWAQHLSTNHSLFVNAATWSLMLTGKLYAPAVSEEKGLGASLKRFLNRTSGTVIRPLIMQSMKIIGKQFVMGRTIDEAIKRAQKLEKVGYRYSYDMLGEAARTKEDALKYFQSYESAIAAIGKASADHGPIEGPGISVKLSALHPRYELGQRDRVLNELTPLLLTLAQQAKAQNIGMTVDAEEADRLELSLDIFESVFSDPSLAGWEGFGLAVQSYQKRAPYVLDWLAELSGKHKRRIMVRLIKGAYWDAEIKHSQMLGLEGYPVFTRKHATDVSFLACAKKLLARPDCFYPQFGTHNAYSVAAIIELAGDRRDFEFQCLHGMGQPLYDQIVGQQHFDIPCRIYAPVGSHIDLLGYLVRRLLENGANTSFINRIADENTPIEHLIQDPVDRIGKLDHKPHPHIPLPKYIFKDRQNSSGLDMSNVSTLARLKIAMEVADQENFVAGPIINGKCITEKSAKAIVAPYQTDLVVGHVTEASANDVEKALAAAFAANASWGTTTAEERAACLDRAANLLEEATPEFMTLLCREGGKHLHDCLSEVREAVDFCRYYAERARVDFAPLPLPGPTGEFNQLSLHPRGTIVCISPWNFPLAIFSGQVLAALVAGNTVIAKPAEQTPLVAAAAVRLFHTAGIPKEALHLLPGQGETVGAKLVADTRVSGVMFTGSTETAKLIQQSLAHREGPIVPFIAETGGQNAMIVDSSALPEQVVMDIMSSAFNSAGQRCSALRVLFLQKDVAPRILEMLKGAMKELNVGDPSLLSTDIGPVIDNDSLQMLHKHVARMTDEAKLIYQIPLKNGTQGHFFGPTVFELDNLNQLQREIFGPILHVICYNVGQLDKVLDEIIASGYGLTLGIHSRIDATVKYISSRMPVGNVYVNRNMIGAVVGVQPFGGERLSGTGPKAGGPHYLPRLCVERAISVNTTAAGGNTTLVSLSEDT
ncbi:MAG: bifunctional proline dehydrogenase/L-glutamate gamma-semialdehyde dehydrogenase PutA [Gammaproteobacteria bacterium]|nr:bifunctional proline dehydrogenase/L-glutamate gamma-semialdehyde dehydrogenase PutA [Gammaproteobacteria bacterium]